MMAKFELFFSCDNAVFDDAPMAEVSRILRDVAQRIDDGDDAGFYRTIRDINGNDIGRFKLIREN